MKMLNWQTRDTRRSAFLSLNEASEFYVIESITFNLAHCTRDGFLSHLSSAYYTISSDSSAFACLWSYRPRTCRVGNDYRTSQQPEQREEWESEIEFHPWIRFMMSLSQYHHHPTNNDSSQESWAKNKMMKKTYRQLPRHQPQQRHKYTARHSGGKSDEPRQQQQSTSIK